MFKTLRDAWSIKDIRKKLLYTLFMIIIFRLGCSLVVPFLDTTVVADWMGQKATNGNFLEYLDILTGGALSQATHLFTVHYPIYQCVHYYAAAYLCTAAVGTAAG